MDAGELVLDCGREEATNRQALLADQLILTAMVDKVKIQFTLSKLAETRSSGRAAFSAALPDKVLRLQRREYFRLSTPIAKPVKFVTTIKRPDGSALLVEASLLDISGGGVGLMASPALAALLPRGGMLTDCKMTLPDEGLLVANLCVRNKFDVTTRGGSRYVRVGCEFMALARGQDEHGSALHHPRRARAQGTPQRYGLKRLWRGLRRRKYHGLSRAVGLGAG
jgi:c-di-GMP-binding flagellar brake protein YcgR